MGKKIGIYMSFKLQKFLKYIKNTVSNNSICKINSKAQYYLVNNINK